MMHQARPVIPSGTIAFFEDVVAIQSRDRESRDLVEAQLFGKGIIVVNDGVERRLIEVYQVHFVDGECDPFDAKQGNNEAVPACLGQHALAGVDQNDR